MWRRPRRARRAILSETTGLALLGLHALAAGCGGNSKSRHELVAGASHGMAGAGAGGFSAAHAGAAGTETGGARASGANGGAAGTRAGASSTAGGAFGGAGNDTAVSGSGGEPSLGGYDAGGAGSGGAAEAGEGGSMQCLDLCSEQAPACCSQALRCASPTSCRIDILAERISTAYQYADLEQAIAALSGAVLLSIWDADVVSAAAEPPTASRFEFDLDDEASNADRARLTGLYNQPFRLVCNDELLFVGVVYPLEGAAAIATPVLHVETAPSGGLVLKLGAWQGAWYGYARTDGLQTARERIDRPELRAPFCARGILNEL